MLFFQQSNAVTRIYSTDNSVLYLTFTLLVLVTFAYSEKKWSRARAQVLEEGGKI